MKLIVIRLGSHIELEPRVKWEIDDLSQSHEVECLSDFDNLGGDGFFQIKKLGFVGRKLQILVGLFSNKLRFSLVKYFYKEDSKKLSKLNPDMVICHGVHEMIIAYQANLKFIFHSEEYLPEQFSGNKLFNFLERGFQYYALNVLLKKACGIISESVAISDKYVDVFDFEKNKTFVMPNTPAYKPDLCWKREASNPLMLIHHGLLIPDRGLDVYVDLMNELGSSAILTLMGPGDDKYLNKILGKLKQPNIIIKAPVSYDAIVDELAKYDLGIIIFGSKHYHHQFMTVPNKFWECLQARLPVVVMGYSAMADIVLKSHLGFVVEGDGATAIAKKIKSVNAQQILAIKERCEELLLINSRDSWRGQLNNFITFV